jgi:hypothetical protein
VSCIALDSGEKRFGIGIVDIAHTETNGVTEFRPTPAQRAADRTCANNCNFHRVPSLGFDGVHIDVCEFRVQLSSMVSAVWAIANE